MLTDARYAHLKKLDYYTAMRSYIRLCAATYVTNIRLCAATYVANIRLCAATYVGALSTLNFEALRYTRTTIVCGLKLLVYAALSY